MTNRRTFIKKISAIGATAPLVTNLKGESSKKNNPIILCSRGEDWGKKDKLNLRGNKVDQYIDFVFEGKDGKW